MPSLEQLILLYSMQQVKIYSNPVGTPSPHKMAMNDIFEVGGQG